MNEELIAEVQAQVSNHVRYQVRGLKLISSNVDFPVWDQVWNQVGDIVCEQIRSTE